jgi:hypothetical protein
VSPQADQIERHEVEHDERTKEWSDGALECRMERRHVTPPLWQWKRDFRRERLYASRRLIDTIHLEAICKRCNMEVKQVKARYGGRRLRGSYKPGEPNYYAPPGTGPISYEAVWGEYVRRFLPDA